MKKDTTSITGLPVKDLAKKSICDGHLFLSINGKRIHLMKPGVLIDPTFIKKYAAINQDFEFEKVSDDHTIEKYKTLFKELKYLQFERDLQRKSLEILKHFQEDFESERHFLSFAMACYEEFCQIPLKDQLRMHECDMHLFRKAIYSAAFSIITGMANDYFHFLILKDFYQLTFTLDIGLCDSNYSYFLAEACNHENRIPGSGRRYLEQENASEEEKELFYRHPERSYRYLNDSSLLTYPELAEVILYQHELSDGSGFPRRIYQGQVSGWEAVVIFSDSLVEINDESGFEENVISFLMNFRSKKLQELPVQRIYKNISQIFEYFNTLKATGS